MTYLQGSNEDTEKKEQTYGKGQVGCRKERVGQMEKAS